MAENPLILVTGATGNVGAALVEKLTARDDFRVRAAARSFTQADEWRAKGVQLAEMDFHRPTSVEAAFEGVDQAFFLTPFVSGFDGMVEQMCHAAQDSGTVKHIVRQSVIGANAEAPLQASRLHHRSEQLIESSGISWTFIRPTAFAQQLTGIFPWIYQHGEDAIYLPIGNAGVAWLDVRDIADVAIEAFGSPAKHASQTYNLTGPSAVGGEEAAALIGAAIGRPLRYVDMDAGDYKQRIMGFGVDETSADQIGILFGDMKDGWLAHTAAGYEQATGRAGTSFAQFVQDYRNVWI